MSKNPLIELKNLRQSFWFDNISRRLIESGELKEMIDQDGLSGITSNPSIFYKSIKDGSDYDDQLKSLFSKGNLSDKDMFYEIAIKDITDAADLLRPVFESSDGNDGFISIEVDPALAYNTESTISEARELYQRINRKNVMIKVPGTKEGLPAIRRLISEGYNINVTLLFSVKRYEEVVDAYISGLEDRINAGKDIKTIRSVASFFVSRIDTATDKILERRLEDALNDDQTILIKSLMGKTAVVNAKTAFQAMVAYFSSDRFLKIKEKGGKIQRLLWASTSTKNPSYSDVMYVNELIGPSTINTMPLDTLKAFKDHGKVRRTIDQDLEEALSVNDSLADININLAEITQKLEDDGVRLFKEAFDSLIALISEKRKALS